MSYRQASATYGIPTSVLVRHKKGNVKRKGGQTVLTEEEENLLLYNINICADWGYPIDSHDLKLIVKNYLDKLGRTVPRFKDNFPGKEFVFSFLKRHKGVITNRLCENIKRSRASVSKEIIEEYFANLLVTLDGIPPTHIINYDETNLADDVGRQKVLTRRGCKHPERVMNTTKSCTSIMFAVTGDGHVLEPYVVYKATNLYSSWTEGGPRNTRYNRTPSGWFDMDCFEDWIITSIIPYFKKLEGRKVLIGDNLASHISINVVKELQKYNIDMVFLPANSTHLTQPLDVAFFRPLKIAWRKILLQWKKGPGRKEAAIPKSIFPRLLKQLMECIMPNAKLNIIAGFRKTGLIPLNKEEVLKQLPNENLQHHESQAINTSILELLKEMRYSEKRTQKPRNKKLPVVPGKSVKYDGNSSCSSSDSEQSEKEKLSAENNEDEGFDIVDEKIDSSSDDELPLFYYGRGKENYESNNDQTPKDMPSTSAQSHNNNICKGDWVLVKFPVARPTATIKNRVYIGKVLSKFATSYLGTFLRKKESKKETEEVNGPLYYYPDIPDESEFGEDQIIMKLSSYTERRGLMNFKNLNTKDYENV